MLRRMLLVLVLGVAAWMSRGSAADSGIGRQVTQALAMLQGGMERFTAAHAPGAVGVQTTVEDRVLPALRQRFEALRGRLAQGSGGGAVAPNMDAFLQSRLGREMVAAQAGGASSTNGLVRR